MPRHTFNFVGGEELTTMGASWFVSYCYWEKCDQNHLNWRSIATYANRISVYNRTRDRHRDYLKRISEMDIGNLSKNRIDLTGTNVKEMAQELLDNWAD